MRKIHCENKKCKQFLYGYFTDMGDRFKAEQFLEE